jgi:hypothetical protein
MNEQSNQYQQLIAKCWADDAFKQRLIADPAETLAAVGIAVPKGMTVRVVENTAQEVTLVIPARSAELTNDELSEVSGGLTVDPNLIPTYPPMAEGEIPGSIEDLNQMVDQLEYMLSASAQLASLFGKMERSLRSIRPLS